jgi:hypothetical protein
VPVFVAALIAAGTIVAFFPGIMSNDSRTLYRQVISNEWNDADPAVMRHLWWVTDRVICGPGGVFLVHVFAYWTGIVLVASYLSSSTAWRAVLVVVLGLFPPAYGLLPMIWKDVGVMSSWMLALGLLLRRERNPQSRTLLVGSLLALLYGAAVRHNAWPALVPLLYIVASGASHEHPRFRARPPRVLRRAALTLTLFALLFGIAQVANRVGARHVIMWAQVPLWDLAAMSVRTGRILVPEYVLINPERNHRMDRLTLFFDTRTVAPLFWGDGAFARFELGPDEARRLLREWEMAIWDHPREYAMHRLGTASGLFGLEARVGGEYYRDRSPVAIGHCKLGPLPDRFREGRAAALVTGGLERLSETHLYRPWVYLLLSAAVITASFLIENRVAFVARHVALSGVLYVAPLLFVAPSIEFRYTIWLFEASIVAVLLMTAAFHERGSLTDSRRRAQDDGGSCVQSLSAMTLGLGTSSCRTAANSR